MVMLPRLEWEETSKNDYYLAQIATELRRIQQMFQKSPQKVSIQDCILPFTKDDETTSPEEPKKVQVHVESDTMRKEVLSNKPVNPSGRDPIEVNTEEVQEDVQLDPKWMEINNRAKAAWAGFLGVQNFGT